VIKQSDSLNFRILNFLIKKQTFLKIIYLKILGFKFKKFKNVPAEISVALTLILPLMKYVPQFFKLSKFLFLSSPSLVMLKMHFSKNGFNICDGGHF
jgi:hypothetical protein